MFEEGCQEANRASHDRLGNRLWLGSLFRLGATRAFGCLAWTLISKPNRISPTAAAKIHAS
jgi:hypothetical protein